jgi:hypothetical protein
LLQLLKPSFPSPSVNSSSQYLFVPLIVALKFLLRKIAFK